MMPGGKFAIKSTSPELYWSASWTCGACPFVFLPGKDNAGVKTGITINVHATGTSNVIAGCCCGITVIRISGCLWI
ncbi:hypothetical protein D3C87_1869030 [compost metagenome]